MTLNFDDVKIIVNCRKCGLPAPYVEPVCGGCGASRDAEIAVARRRFAEKVVGLCTATEAILRNPDAITRMVRAMRPADVRGLCKAAGETARRFRRGLMLNPDVEIILTCDRCGWRGPAADPLACGGCGASLAAAQSAVARARAAFARPHVR